MIRTLIAVALCGAAFFTAVPVHAEGQPTAPAAPTTANPSSSVKSAAAAPGTASANNQPTAPRQLGANPVLTETAPITAAAALTLSNALTVTEPAPGAAVVTDTLTAGEPLTALAEITVSEVLTQPAAPLLDPSLDTQYAGVLEGTIIANRTEANVRFFVEGQVYDLSPLRALGLPLPRPTAILNLFNCDARQSESETGCFWDPYLLKQEGFYEVVSGDEAGAQVSLILREAGAPPANQIWVQNRTGERESIIVNSQVIEIAPASIQQFSIEGEGPVVVHLRNCITQGAQSACEWAPQGVDPGYYYALVKLSTNGANNTTVTSAKLEGVVASSGEAVERPPQASCLLRVPTLNVRGGPGLEFPVIAKVRGSEEQPGSVVVIGYDASKQWMQVSDRIAASGWVTSNPDFIICTGDMAALPVAGGAAAAEAAPGADALAAAEPTADAAATADATAADATAEVPQDTSVVETTDQTAIEETPVTTDAEATVDATADGSVSDGSAADTSQDATGDAAGAAPEETPTVAPIPTGQARLVVNNGFDQIIRFTLDQQYRSERDNLSGEWDLQPGQSVSILVFPGMVPFSVSSPWGGLSGNANITVDAEQERSLWLYFIPDPDGSGKWVLQF